jgi:predicted DNA-binding helix-hairpin-helix protein
MAWAEVNLKQFPLEVNRASPRELMRVPGFGKLAVHKIMQARRQGRVHSMEDLQKIGIQTRRAAPYILLDGKRPLHQLTIWQKPGLIA